MLEQESLDTLFSQEQGLQPLVQKRLQQIISLAFQEDIPEAKHEVHRTLFALYEQNVLPGGPGVAPNQYHPFLLDIRHRLEEAWERFELGRIQLRKDEVPSSPEAFVRYFRQRYANHPATRHKIFDFLETEAHREPFVRFFISDCTLNIRFYDLVALSLVGLHSQLRQELAQNFWDEMGHGTRENEHNNLFKRMLDYVGAQYDPGNFAESLGWQGLAGYNLFLRFGLHRKHFLRSIGNMAVSEMMDPANYAKLVKGCKRVGLTDEKALTYYLEHVSVDVAHGDGWIANVMLPMANQFPNHTCDILIGAEMRLNTCFDYYENLYSQLTHLA